MQQVRGQNYLLKGLSQKPVLGLAFVFLGSALVSACGTSRYQNRWRSVAPQSQNDVGIVVELQPNRAVASIESMMEKNEKVQVRSVNPEKGLYEVFNASNEEVQAELKPESSFKNVFFKNAVPKNRITSVDLGTCKKGTAAPKAVIEPTVHQTKLSNEIIDMKDGAVAFTASRSTSGSPAAGALEFLWVINGPQGSAFEAVGHEGPTLTFQPDMPGSYLVQLVAQDRTSLCGVSGFEFGVTTNDPYLGTAAARPYNPATDAARFHHLGEIGAETAWTTAKGAGVVIAILDTGVNYNHPDLRPNIAINSKEVEGNNIDDDLNGYVDDAYGWDFYMNDPYALDDNSHGTHVAGLAASAVSGVAPLAKVLPVKVLGATGSGDLASIVGGIMYAADRGANIINMSLGMDTFGLSLDERQSVYRGYKKAVDYAKAKGVVLAIAAGNGDPYTGKGFDIDKSPVYPASVASPNLVAVASVDSAGSLTDYSNFGVMSVQIAAPGGTDTKPLMAPYYFPSKGQYVGLAGTSMATPVIAGSLALVKSVNRSASPEQLIRLLTTSGTLKNALQGKVKSGSEVNVTTAVQKAAVPAPAPWSLEGLLKVVGL